MTNAPIHPFVGLRPFEENEEHLFFGREKLVDALMSRLRTSRFLSVTGTSGSGKSSLVKCGILPALYRGFMAGAGSHWRVGVFRPGNDPVGNLAKALDRACLRPGNIDLTGEYADMENIQGKFTETTLRRSKRGIVEVVAQAGLKQHDNLLLVVDQFEELFRFSRLEKESASGWKRDSIAFIELLLESVKQTWLPVYIILTMRSDFLGDCTQFHGLPEAINDGQYLIPRMTRQEKRQAIAGPTAVGGAAVSPPLMSQLLNDVGDEPDHLPILQHALMRTWDYWLENSGDGEPLGLHHYEAIGSMKHAISLHAEEAFNQLETQRSRTICEKMFKLITHMEMGSRGVRRPATISEICSVAEASEEEVIEIVEVFRKPGRTFLMPPHGTPLDEESVIDISHESFMRIWGRLVEWVKEESKSAELYLRLASASELYQKGEAPLWRDPALMMGLKWLEETKPNTAWAQRYDPEFHRAIQFLEDSRLRQEHETAEKERARKIKVLIKRVTIAAIVLAAVAAGSVFLTIATLESKKEAQEQRRIAVEQREKTESINLQLTALTGELEDKTEILEEQKAKIEKEKERTEEKRKLAVRNEAIANAAQKEAGMKAILEEIQGVTSDLNKREADFLHYLAKAKELAVHAIAQNQNKTLKVQLALTAFRMNGAAYSILEKQTREKFTGFDTGKMAEFPNSSDISTAYAELEKVYKSLQQTARDRRLPPEMFEALRTAYIANEENRDIIYRDAEAWSLAMARGDKIVFNHRDGRLLMGALHHENGRLPAINAKLTVTLSNHPFQATAFAQNGGGLYCGTSGGRVLALAPDVPGKNRPLVHHPAKILAMAVSGQGHTLLYSVKNVIYRHNTAQDSEPREIFKTGGENYIRAIAYLDNNGGETFVAADSNGYLSRLVLTGNHAEQRPIVTGYQPGRAIHAIAYDPRGKRLVIADDKGKLHFFAHIRGKFKYIKIDKAHKGIVKALAFSPNGKYLASGGLDGTVMLWDLEDIRLDQVKRKTPVLIITGQRRQRILALRFDSQNRHLVFSDGKNLRICPTRPETFVERLCQRKWPELKKSDWDFYVGESIPRNSITVCPRRKNKEN